MTVNVNSVGGAVRANNANANTVADMLRAIGFGSLLRRQKVALRRQNPNAFAAGAASAYDGATLQVLFLPDDAKAAGISRAYARAGTTVPTNGEMTVEPPNTTPASTQVAVQPSGNIAFLATDALTDVDLEYDTVVGDVVEVITTAVPGTGVATIPSKYAGTAGSGTPSIVTANVVNQQTATGGVLILIEAEILAGTTTGKKIILQPAAGAPATGKAQLNVAKSTVQFAVADAPTQVRLKMICIPGTNGTGATLQGVDLNQVLESNAVNF